MAGYRDRDASLSSNPALVIVSVMTVIIPFIAFGFAFFGLTKFTLWAVREVARHRRELADYQVLHRRLGEGPTGQLRAATSSAKAMRDAKHRVAAQQSRPNRRGASRRTVECSIKSCCCCCCDARSGDKWCREWRTRAISIIKDVHAKLPAPYDTSFALISYLFRTKRNSLRVFLATRTVPVVPDGPFSTRVAQGFRLFCPILRWFSDPEQSASERASQEHRYTLEAFKSQCECSGGRCGRRWLVAAQRLFVRVHTGQTIALPSPTASRASSCTLTELLGR